LVVEIEPPLPDTIIQILSQKARERGLDAPQELLEELAASSQGTSSGDIRVLEGLLARTAAGLSLFGAPANRETLRRIISSPPGSSHPDRIVSTEIIQQAVAAAYNLKTSDLLGPSRSRSVAAARHVAMFLARRMTNLQIQEIGGHFGGRDHSSVIYAIKKITEAIARDRSLARLVEGIEKSLSSAGRV
jgi:chromosomal replication initiator protein